MNTLSSNFQTQSKKDYVIIHRMKHYSIHNSSIKDALKKSGYEVNLKYIAKTIAKPNKNKQRYIIWFKRTFNKSVKKM